MSRQICINLPVADLSKSMAFFKALGFSHNPQFADDTAACIVISETILVMLLTHPKFTAFSPKPICDTSKAVEVLLCLSCESRAQVDDMAAKAVEAGATNAEATDYGFMYQHSFADPDGHCWALNYMSAMPPQM
jgi:predicted lactoylglutathione lyase